MNKTTFKLLHFCFFLIFLNNSFSQVSSRQIYVSDIGVAPNFVERILKYDANGENGEVFINDNNNYLDWPQDIVFIEDQNIVLISNLLSGEINRFDATTGVFISHFATGLGQPTRMKVRDDILYVLQWNNFGPAQEHVLRFELDGTPLGPFTQISGVFFSIGMDWDVNGSLYVSGYSNPVQIKEYDEFGVPAGTFADGTNITNPTNIWFDPSGTGDLFVNDFGTGQVKKFDSSGNYLGVVVGGLENNEGVAVFPENNDFLIGNGANNGMGSIKRYSADGTYLGDFISPGSGGLVRPNAVVIREPSLSISEVDDKNDFISPSIGNMFYFQQNLIDKLDKIELYSIDGRFQGNINLNDNYSWDASSYSNGIYFIRILEKNRAKTQKIVISNK